MTFNCGASNSATITFQNSTYSDDGALQYRNGDRAMTFKTAGSERVRIDSSGRLLVNKSGTNFGVEGVEIGGSDGKIFITRDANSLYLNRTSSDGNIIEFYKDSVEAGRIGSVFTSSASRIFIANSNTGVHFNGATQQVIPCNSTGAKQDNSIDLGNLTGRYDDVYATNGTIQTSDRNEKQDIEELSDAEQRVAVVAKGLLRKYRWIDSVAEKGDNARTHFGIIAQDLQDAFTAEGLDAGDYAMFISNTWWEKEITVDAVEANEENGIEAQDAYTYMDEKEEATEGYTKRTRLGVRYSQLLAFIISAI
jgi:Tfp pilus assembly protein FimT